MNKESNKIKIITKDWYKVDPRSIESYKKKGGYQSLKKVLREMKPTQIIEEVTASGLQGRGGAGFLTGKKWQITANQKCKEKYFICNLDESEPGTFKDRMIAENNPHQLIEGIIIGSYAVGAKKAFIYLNGNFQTAKLILKNAIKQAYEENILGKSIIGMVCDLELEIFSGAGGYICGEETALLNSMEGKRGEPRMKTVFPCESGLFCKPTAVNNAETIANIPWIIKKGAKKFAEIGMKKSPGTKLFCIDGAIKKPNIYEAPIGINVRDLIHDYAGGLQDGTELWFAQVGGSSGRLALPSQLDEIPSYSKDSKIPLGQGSLLIVDKFQDIKKIVQSWINFFQRESCGKCVPCREGLFRLKSIIDRLNSGDFNKNDREDLEKIIWTLDNTTFCPLGKFSVVALKDVIKYGLVEELRGW